MQVRYFKEYSPTLNRDMEFKIYGHAGPLCLVIPCQDGRFYEWEDRGMFNLVSDYIDQGKVQFVTVDTIDTEAWSTHHDSATRMARQESWMQYLVNELIPSALDKTGKSQDEQIMVMGASMGAVHAANLFFRFPQRFFSSLSMSGVYDLSSLIYDGSFDQNFYNNNLLSYLPSLPADHPYIALYNQKRPIFVIGQGSWEEQGLKDTRYLDTICAQKGIHARFYYWGYGTPHDWPSWEKQFRTYLPEMLGQ